ncbi:MAG TPA: hypothetical protein VLB68_07510 [Pyrinomonadaceae bacterium]|nr:hypothetical protein [Pyrinomonadaceae bacterium]
MEFTRSWQIRAENITCSQAGQSLYRLMDLGGKIAALLRRELIRKLGLIKPYD